MISQQSLDYIKSIAVTCEEQEDKYNYRVLRTIEEVGHVTRCFRHNVRYIRFYSTITELFICSLVNVFTATNFSAHDLNTRLKNRVQEEKRKNLTKENEENGMTSIAVCVGELTKSFRSGASDAEFAFHSFNIAEECYLIMKGYIADPDDDYLNAQIATIYQMWSAKRQQYMLETALSR